MHANAMFTLAKHAGAYETWPLRTLLLLNGQPTGSALPGYVIKYQFAVGRQFLLVTDWDCPHEESTEVLLLDHDYRILSHRSFSSAYKSWALQALTWLDAQTCTLDFGEGLRFRLTIRTRGIPWVWPRLGLKRLAF